MCTQNLRLRHHTVAVPPWQLRHVLAMPPRLGRSQANAEPGFVPQHVALFRGVGFVERQRCAEAAAGVMEIAVGQLCFSELSTVPTGTSFIEICAVHCGALRISCELCLPEAAVPSNNRRGQWISVFGKHEFPENGFFPLEANTEKSKKSRFIRAQMGPRMISGPHPPASAPPTLFACGRLSLSLSLSLPLALGVASAAGGQPVPRIHRVGGMCVCTC